MASTVQLVSRSVHQVAVHMKQTQAARLTMFAILIAIGGARSLGAQKDTPMVQVIENRAELVGRVTAVAPHPTLAEYDVVTVTADSVGDVAGYPNLVRPRAAKPIAVTVPRACVAALALSSGDHVAMRVRLSGPTSVIADPESVHKP